MSDTRNHRELMAEALREAARTVYQNGGTYTVGADALLASPAIAAVRAAAWDEALVAVANERGSFGMQTRNPYRAETEADQ